MSALYEPKPFILTQNDLTSAPCILKVEKEAKLSSFHNTSSMHLPIDLRSVSLPYSCYILRLCQSFNGYWQNIGLTIAKGQSWSVRNLKLLSSIQRTTLPPPRCSSSTPRIGHTNVTYGYFFSKATPPLCQFFNHFILHIHHLFYLCNPVTLKK